MRDQLRFGSVSAPRGRSTPGRLGPVRHAPLSIDEARAASRDGLAVIGAAVQEATRGRWPRVVAVAGLPALRARASHMVLIVDHALNVAVDLARVPWGKVALYTQVAQAQLS